MRTNNSFQREVTNKISAYKSYSMWPTKDWHISNDEILVLNKQIYNFKRKKIESPILK